MFSCRDEDDLTKIANKTKFGQWQQKWWPVFQKATAAEDHEKLL